MKVWILEQDISRGENLGRMVKKIFGKCGSRKPDYDVSAADRGGFSLETTQR